MSVYRNDRLEYLQKALESLWGQSVQCDIYIQLDGTVSLEIEQYLNDCLSSEKIVYLGKRDENLGLAESLNQLLYQVLPSYEYIARMDADDIAVENRMESQIFFMENHPEVDVSGGYIEEFSDEIDYNKVVQYPLSHNEMFAFFAKRVPLAHVTAMFRRRFFKKAGLYPIQSRTNEDTLMWMNGFKNGCRFANIPKVLVHVRVNAHFFNRRGGMHKAWSDLRDRFLVIQTLGYNVSSYWYAWALFGVNIAPERLKRFLYERLR
jgi:hypothetical protein